MSQPSQQPLPPKKTAGTRSRTGCWTCRARRKKCDEKRPGCTPCATKGVPCGGYGARLKWGNGVASRGYLTGASIPVPRAEGNNTARKGAAAGVKGTAKKDANGKEGRGVPDGKGKGVGGPGPVGGAVMVMDMGMGMDMGTSKTTEPVEEGYKSGELVLDFGQGPARNEASRVSPSPAAGSSSIGSSVATPDMLFSDAMVPDGVRLSPFDAMLFQEFKEWGSFYLWVSADTSKPPFHDVLSLCAHSKSLLANCLTFQLSLHPEYEGKFDEYYAESLRLFRQDVVEPSYMMKDATLVSGILLCSIGMTRCLTWTVHLNGMYSILQYRHTVSDPTALTSDIVDTIGFLDLPTHILGRQSKTLNIWHDYCRGKSGIESVSGLPYSLVDLFSTITAPDIEMQFLTWTGAGIQAKPVQRRAWDAIRFAGILCARQHRQVAALPYQHAVGPPTETLVQAIVDCLRDLLQTSRDEACSFLNLLLFPAFIAGTQCHVLSVPQRTCIDAFWGTFFLGDEEDGGGGGTPMLEAPLDLLHEMWTNGQGRTADQIAREWELEIGLF